MNRKTLTVAIGSLLILASGSAGVSGAQPAAQVTQDEESALIMVMEGDLWLWQEMPATFEQLTRTGHNAQPVLSPDASRVAYTSVAEIGIAALESPAGTGDSPLPIDIGLLEIETGEATAVATQPAGASFMTEGTPDNYITRSAPTWSPDGAVLAWMDYSVVEGAYRLVTYDLATGSAKAIVPELPEQSGTPTIRDPKWGIGGIALHLPVYNESNSRFEEAFLVYDADGALKADVRQSTGEGGSVVDFFWMSDGAKDYIGVAYSSGRWAFIDPATGDRQSLSGTPELYSLAYPAESGRLSFIPAFDQQAGLSFTWMFVSADDQSWELPFTGGPAKVALSSTGQTAAYVGDEGVYIWREGQPGKIAGTEPAGGDPAAAVVWGVTGWRMSAQAVVSVPTGGPTPTQAQTPAAPPSDFECPGAPPPRLAVGAQGRVTPGTPNRMRAEPGGRYLRDIPAGGVFDVLEGPVCEDGFVWWKVRYRSVEGWTVEGRGDEYWLEPAQ